VHEGSVLNVASLDAEPGSRVELGDILLVSDEGRITVGKPTVADALVVAEVVTHGKGRKVINFKYKAKVRYRRKRGHRQAFTRLTVQEIRFGGRTAVAPQRRSPVEQPVAELVEEPAIAEEEQVNAEPAAVETAAPRRRRRRAAEGEQE